MEIDYIFPLRIVSSTESARAKILTEWKAVFRPNIFTSKTSNLLLLLGSEGFGVCESYPTSEVSNKYIHDAFLMIYLYILFFFTFWYFKGVIQRFAKAVIL